QVAGHPAADVAAGQFDHQPINPGMLWYSCWVNSISWLTSQGPSTIRVKKVNSRRGRKLRVCSLICVAAWNTATIKPTTRLGNTITATITVVNQTACRNRSTAISGVIARLLGDGETGGQGTDDQRPAIHQHKQHDLERQGDDQRRQHHH